MSSQLPEKLILVGLGRIPSRASGKTVQHFVQKGTYALQFF